ncbi:hypothetical protein KKE78_02275, partial [Patescibacteria group bacterium]|nr:hypothetical protein [Patescibacteria group bacterium]
MLSLSTSLRKKHTEDPYHIAELYRELKVELLMAKKRREMTEIPNPAKATAMNAAFEGGAGTQGGGTANLSFRATG